MKLNLRYIITIMFLSLFTCISAIQNTNSDKFDRGVTFFTSGNYKEALKEWTDIYTTGIRSANLNYNIGNAYFKLNDIPDAILFYERAYLLDPSDENNNYNLQIARTLTVDRFQEIPELFFVRWFNFVSLFFSSNSWAIISLTSFILCLIFLSLYLYSSKYYRKVIGFWIAMFLFVLSVSTITFSLRNKLLVTDNNKAIITSPIVNGKSSPDNSGNDLFVLHEGTKITIEDEVGGWFEIRLSDGNKGWVPVNTITKI